VDCQPSDFQNSQPTSAIHLTNEQVAQDEQNPQAALVALNQLGRLDGFEEVFSAFPGERSSTSPRAITTCYVEVYSTRDGAAAALVGPRTFPPGESVQEVASPPVGQNARAWEGTVTDQNTGRPTPTTVIIFQVNRFVASVTINGTQPNQSLPAAAALANALAARMARYQ